MLEVSMSKVLMINSITSMLFAGSFTMYDVHFARICK